MFVVCLFCFFLRLGLVVEEIDDGMVIVVGFA